MMTIFVLSILVVVVMVQGGISVNPNKKYWDYQAKNCTPNVRKNLCTDCLLVQNNIDASDGKFWDTNKVYNVENPECQAAIAEYNEDNPCDKTTNQCLTKWLNNPNDQVCRSKLDRMLYTVCELCCDCIPIGASKGEYSLDVSRPNCALHAFFDNCDYYPTMHNNICNAVFNHKKNEAAKQKTYAWLEQAMVQYNCASQPLWDVCYILEKGQNRI